MIFPKPEWISYKATHWKAGVGEDEINIYAHGSKVKMTLLENGKVKCFYCKGRGIVYELNFSRDDVNPEICPKCKGDKYEK